MTTHAYCRLKERYNVTTSIWEVCKMIRSGEGKVVESQIDGNQLIHIRVEGVLVRLVYDPRNSTIITVLPPVEKGEVYTKKGPSMRQKEIFLRGKKVKRIKSRKVHT